jgi:HEAT repeat protein
MSFYLLSKEERKNVVRVIYLAIYSDLKNKESDSIVRYFSDEDTYIRKAAYLGIGKIYKDSADFQKQVLLLLSNLLLSPNEKVRQSAVNAAGEIGVHDFTPVKNIFDKGLFDAHHIVRNAVIGSVKKMGEKNPRPVLDFARQYLHHPDKEIRREICHGIELRGRTHPEDILPLLKELQFDQTARVRNTLVHVIGQISYRKGCLEKVIADLKKWENKTLVKEVLEEIIDVHERYKDFSAITQEQAIQYIEASFKDLN